MPKDLRKWHKTVRRPICPEGTRYPRLSTAYSIMRHLPILAAPQGDMRAYFSEAVGHDFKEARLV
jgi:hypothetical protein